MILKKLIANNLRLFFSSYHIKSLLNYIPGEIKLSGENHIISKSKIVGYIKLKSHVKINDSFFSGNISIGRFTSINGPNTSIISSSSGKITIGSFCSIARGVQIQEFNHKFNRVTSYFIGQNIFNMSRSIDISSKGDINISDDVWIGANVIILSGVTIGRGAIIAAGSIVIKDVNAYSIVAGVPASEIKIRFSKNTISILEESKWWTWNLDKIKSEESFFFKDRF